MKKFLSLLLIALMMFTVLFVSVSCTEPEQVTPTPEPEPEVDPTKAEHCDPILPIGTGQTIPTNWSVDERGMKDLPAIIYNFPGYDSATKTYSPVSETNVTPELKAAIATAQADPEFFDDTPTNIIFLFSDGWGVTEVKMSREYKGELIMDSLPYASESKTDSYLKYTFDNVNSSNYTSKTTTDSCAGGTQVLCGYKTRYGYIAMDVDANPITNLIEAAHSVGWKTAVVTNDNIVDATPADAMIHDTNRYHSDVLYYKALIYALIDQQLDLLMGWDWGMSTYFTGDTGTWADRLDAAMKEGIKDALGRSENSDIKAAKPFDKADTEHPAKSDPITWFKALPSTEYKARVASFMIYYHLWEEETGKLNSFQTWTTTGGSDLTAFEAWLDNPKGLAAAIANLDTTYGNPADSVNRFTSFKDTLANKDTNFEKPVLASWLSDGNDYEHKKPNRGYAMYGTIAKNYPSWPEMVAYTIYQMDKEAEAADTGFFCIIENTCTDGWGHSGNYDTKYIGMMNEVQCLDEGIAIAVKYVLEHPDTLLVISADHETGGYTLRSGWENDITQIKSTTTGHSSQNVPLYAFGAGAQNFSPEAILAKYGDNPKAGVSDGGKVHEGWITGAIMGELMTGSAFGQPDDYKGN